jgi:glycosyltransferase involved in cell wall biosynthesis
MILEIQIPSTPDRSEQTKQLVLEIKRQIKAGAFSKAVNVKVFEDDKTMSIGAKRNMMYQKSKGIYTWQIDSDDWIHPKAIRIIMEATVSNPDCITFKELIIWDGNRIASSNFDLNYFDWADNSNGYDFTRTPFFKTPIKTEICQKVQVQDIRFAEDHQFAKDIKPLLKSQVYIDHYIYFYTPYKTPFNERYGIK